MKSYLIVYQLSLPESTYANLITYLKTAPKWARPCNSTWFIKTTLEAAKVRDGIKERMNQNDKVLVTEVKITHWGTFNISKEVTEWMKTNL